MAGEFLEFLEFLEDLDNNNEIRTRPRIQRSRPDLFNNYDELDFFKRYRMLKSTALFILDQIDQDLEFTSDRNGSVPPINQLLITLRFYATGSHQLMVGDLHGVHVSTVSRIIKRVSRAIVGIRSRYIKMPSTDTEIRRCQRDFFRIANFPNIIGTIDCTHIKIQSPVILSAYSIVRIDYELYLELWKKPLPVVMMQSYFVTGKAIFSINCQTISAANLKVQNIVARWPGSTHDSAIFANSRVCQEFESGRYGNACLLGDSGYPLKAYLLTPYLNPRTEAEERYNMSQIKTRNTVERQYGVIKRRFPALAIGLRIKLETAIDVIIACCILHNICVDFGEDLPPNELEEGYLNNLIHAGQIRNGDGAVELHQNGIDRRSVITQSYFT